MKWSQLKPKQKERFASKAAFKERKATQAAKPISPSTSLVSPDVSFSDRPTSLQIGPLKPTAARPNPFVPFKPQTMAPRPTGVGGPDAPQRVETTTVAQDIQQQEDTDYGGQLTELFEGLQGQTDLTFEQFKERMRDPAYRARVQGIRFADRGTGGMTQRQLARSGTKGVFGRTGLRISSLNL